MIDPWIIYMYIQMYVTRNKSTINNQSEIDFFINFKRKKSLNTFTLHNINKGRAQKNIIYFNRFQTLREI